MTMSANRYVDPVTVVSGNPRALRDKWLFLRRGRPCGRQPGLRRAGYSRALWGSAKYLTNLDAISQYGDRVTLCSTGEESRAFYDELAGIAREHGFRTWYDEPRMLGTARTGSGRRTARRSGRARTTGGTTRDRLIRNALLAGVVTER